MLKLLFDYDGTLTAEELQVPEVARRSLVELADTILGEDLAEVEVAYAHAAAKIRSSPHQYGWRVNGLLTSFADEGAFILHTVTLQTMLVQNARYRSAVAARFAHAEYDPVAACTNYLFHTHSAPLNVEFRAGAADVLSQLMEAPDVEPIVMSSSLGTKIERNLARLGLGPLRVLGDTRQYEIDPGWLPPIPGGSYRVQADAEHALDLRRHAYYDSLAGEMRDGSQLLVVADTLSLPGALPMAIGIPFALVRTNYTPRWCAAYVEGERMGQVVGGLDQVPGWLVRAADRLEGGRR
jgi:hypothetical protein